MAQEQLRLAMITQEKMQKEWIWVEEDWKAMWEECYSIVVLDKAVVEEALERVVERVVLYPITPSWQC